MSENDVESESNASHSDKELTSVSVGKFILDGSHFDSHGTG